MLCIVESQQWPQTERDLIANSTHLLNIAPGGDEPHCPSSVRASNGRNNAAKRDPGIGAAKRHLGQMLRQGYMNIETRDKYIDFCLTHYTFEHFIQPLRHYTPHRSLYKPKST
ncbi:MAG: hypothetical protein NVS1B11_36630 [Terriglobales bacterium]